MDPRRQAGLEALREPGCHKLAMRHNMAVWWVRLQRLQQAAEERDVVSPFLLRGVERAQCTLYGQSISSEGLVFGAGS